MKQPENAVVVAVAPGGAQSALTFAVEVSRRTKSAIHLVSVLERPADEAYSLPYGGAIEAADGALDEAARFVESMLPGVSVTTERVEDEKVATGLLDRADHGRMVVLQHRHLSRLRRAITGSTANAVASRAQVPVVTVPEGWAPQSDRPHVVTVAVQDSREAEPILRTAFEQAEMLRAKVVVLHAWWLASGFDVVVADDEMRNEEANQTQRELAPDLARMHADFPVVPVEVQVVHAPPTEALLDAAEVSTLVVMGRRHHLLPFGTHLGPVARAVIDRSSCPVLMAPEKI